MTAVVRVHYRERQRLLTADLLAEQQYRLAIAGRHALAPHRWGVVRGLTLVVSGRDVIVQPGLAIDGFGREIVVPEAVRAPGLDLETCAAVLLYYCEAAVQRSPGCVQDPAPRIGHRFRIRTVPVFGGIIRVPQPIAGRAAGKSDAPWPVLLGYAGKTCQWVDPDSLAPLEFSRVPYARIAAAAMRSPSGTATMRLGTESRSDVFVFLLNTAGSAPTRRLAIDRDGTVHVWRPLIVLGTQGRGQAQLSANVILNVELPTISATTMRPIVMVTLDPQLAVISATLQQSGFQRLESPKIKIAKTKGLDASLAFADGRPVLVRMLQAAQAVPPFSQVGGRGAYSQPAFDTVAVEVRPFGGVLRMKSASPAAEPPPVKDCEPPIDAAQEPRPSLVRFMPGAEGPLAPTVREIQALKVMPETTVPRFLLRVAGGEKEDGSSDPRFSVGDRRPGSWLPVLTMEGDGSLVLGTPFTAGADAPPVGLNVTGTVYLPPIGKDDPLVPNLLAQAFMAGLLQMGQTTTDVTLNFSDPPAKIVNGQKLEYKITIARNTGTQPVKIKRALETISAVAGGSGSVLRTISDLPDELAGTPIVHSVKQSSFSIDATKAKIVVQLLIKIGTADRVVRAEITDIPVEEPEE
jgi:hypothetical protein